MIPLSELSLARAGAYKLLAQAFYLPNERTLSESFIEDLEEIFTGLGIEEAEGFRDSVFAEDCDDLTTEIRVDYTKLFHGSGKLLAPPYESLYKDGKHVMGESAVAVRNFYRKAGLDMAEDYKNLPDHISAELELLYFLCLQEAEVRKAEKEASHWLELQQQFYHDHLATWVDDFCQRTIEYAQTAYYRKLGILLQKWCQLDQVLIEEQLKQ